MRSRVLHIIPALIQGGAEKLLFDLVSRSPKIDMKVITLLADPPFFPLDARFLDSLAMQRGRLSPRLLWRLRAKINEFRPDLIHAWLYHGNLFSLAAAGLSIPIVWSIHNTTLSAEHSKKLTRLANRLCARLSRRMPARIVYCAASAREVHERIGYDPARGLVIENGIDLEAFAFDGAARGRIRREIGLATEDYAVGSVARFDPQKNHRLLVEAFARAGLGERARLVLAGRGCTAENPQLTQWLDEFGVRERTVLFGQRHDVPAVLSALDLLVSASAYGEAMPLAIIEAAAVGLPVITTDVGDARALVLDPADVVAPATADSMAAAICRVRAHSDAPDLAQRKLARRDRIARDFSLAGTIARYHDLYRTLALPA